MKIITVCGSYRHKKEIARASEALALEGNCVITPIELTRNKSLYTKKEIDALGRMHKEKIKLSDAIFVVNVGGYIGDATRGEIEYAKRLGKEIIYFVEAVSDEKCKDQ